jgi:hypothetical protein
MKFWRADKDHNGVLERMWEFEEVWFYDHEYGNDLRDYSKQFNKYANSDA